MTNKNPDATTAMMVDGPTARALAAALKAGALTAVAATEACLARIDALEPHVHAWAWLDRDLALAQARAADVRRAAGAPLAALHGVPIGVKDIVDTADMPTELGTPVHRGRRPTTDATIVKRLRSAGAVVLGKTVTSEYALYTPGPTRNPHNRERSPGGSSSGSAAAVAAGMVPLTIATQTNGSTIRPASFCGIVGYKPSLGMLPRAGILEQSPTLDQPGVMANDVGDVAFFVDALTRSTRLVQAVEAPHKPRLALVRGPYWQRVDADAQLALETYVASLGAMVEEVILPPQFDNAADVHRTIMEFEIGIAFHEEYRIGRALMSDVVRSIVERGMATTLADYRQAQAAREAMMAAFAVLASSYDVLLTPAATGAAPAAIVGTGDPIFGTIWTLLGAPAITLPLLEADDGMPVGVQLVAVQGDDEGLLSAAAWIERHHSPEKKGRT